MIHRTNKVEKQNRSRRKLYNRPYPAVLLFLLLLLITFISSCSPKEGSALANLFGNSEDTGEEMVEEPSFAVRTVDASKGNIIDYLKINGDVVSKGSVDVYPDSAGKLLRLYKESGDYVEKDEVVADVDPAKPGMNYVASQVKAPISGTITSIPVQIGSTVAPSMPIITIGRLNELQIKTHVAERFISRVYVGLWADVILEAYPDVTFNARVTELSPVVDPISRTMEVTLSFSNNDNRIKSGMFASLKIYTNSRKDVVTIPSDAIVNRFGEALVFVVTEDSRVEKRVIQPGISVDGIVEVTEGLSPGDTVVIQGQTLLEDGVKVRMLER